MTKEYNELFSDLGGMPGFRKKAPHKAVLLLSIIELYAKGLLNKNEIRFDDSLKQAFLKTWSTHVYNNYYEPNFYLPFWELQNDGFWHIVPNWRKENVFDSLKYGKRELSEESVQECIEYAELDEDLYFLLTMRYSRNELHKTLLQYYFDYSSSAADYYINNIEELSHLENSTIPTTPFVEDTPETNTHYEKGQESPINNIKDFSSLSLDVKIQINIDFYTYLKESAYDREAFLDIIPDVQSLYNVIVNNYAQIANYSFSMKMSFASFLRDLKISLMSYNDTIWLIDCIDQAINLMNDSYSLNNKDVEIESKESDSIIDTYIIPEERPESENNETIEYTEIDEVEYEKNIIEENYVDEDRNQQSENIEERFGASNLQVNSDIREIPSVERFEVDRKNYRATQSAIDHYISNCSIQNNSNHIQIINDKNNVVYNSTGYGIMSNGNFYRINRTYSTISINKINLLPDKTFETGDRILHATGRSFFYLDTLHNNTYAGVEIQEKRNGSASITYNGSYYTSEGGLSKRSTNQAESNTTNKQTESLGVVSQELKEPSSFEPKGNLASITSTIDESFDYLFIMSIIECIHIDNTKKSLSMQEIGSMMIALVWEMQTKHPDEIMIETGLNKCANYVLQAINTKNSDIIINTKEELFGEISHIASDPKISNAISILTGRSTYNILRPWFPKLDQQEIYIRSLHFSKSCLYAIYPREKDPYIVINPGWINYLKKEFQNLQDYFMSEFLKFLVAKR